MRVKYYFTCIVICMLMLSGCNTGASNEIKNDSIKVQDSVKQEAGNSTSDIAQISTSMDEMFNGISKVELAYGEKTLFATDDVKIITTIASYLKQCAEPFNAQVIQKPPMTEYDKIILYNNDGTKKEIKYLTDNVKEIAGVLIEGKWLSIDFDFIRYIQNLLRYNNHFTDVAQDAADLFNKYNWTVDYRVNSFSKALPEDLKHSTGELPFEIYWANCIELSKSIGLNFNSYLGKQVDIELYCLREKLPMSANFPQDSRGIILRSDGKIIGAYIDGGYYGITCSLEGKTLEDVVHKDWDTWVKNYINYDDEFEKYLTKLGPEDVIKEYFKALNNHDAVKSMGCKIRSAQYDMLFINMDINQLYNESYQEDIIKKAVFKDIKKWELGPDNENQIKYYVSVDYEFTKYFAPGEGPHFVTVVRDDKLGWRILGLGTGP